MSKEKVLIIDDDKSITILLDTMLTEEGFHTSIAMDGETALLIFEQQPPDLILLDLKLPGLSGIEVLRSIRSRSQIPVIIITGQPDDEVETQCLDIGADNFFQKPFSPTRLLAHIDAILRRTANQPPQQKFVAGDMEINFAARTVLISGKKLNITKREFDVLGELVANEGKVVYYADLLTKFWGEEYRDEVKYIQDCVWTLRQKIETDPANPKYIINYSGIGYRFQNQ